MKAEERCKETVFSGERWDFRGHQCSRRAVEDGYCRLHATKRDKGFQQRLRNHESAVRSADRKTSAARYLLRAYDQVIEHVNQTGNVGQAVVLQSYRASVQQELLAAEDEVRALQASAPKRGES